MTLQPTIPVTLPHGSWEGGRFNRDAELRALTGDDEMYLLDMANGLSPASKVTQILSRCLERLGSETNVSKDSVNSLTVGDRESLLLQLQRLTFGEGIGGVVRCPVVDCEEKMDLNLTVEQLLLPPYEEISEGYEMDIELDDERYHVKFRLPTGGDQEAIAVIAGQDPQAAANQLLSRCLLDVSSEVLGNDVEAWPDEAREQLSVRMAELDPQAELELNLTCVSCGHAFSTLLDTASFLLGELADFSRDLHREVHLLALHHHWSESEILAMTPIRRRRYLECLVDTLESARSAS